MILTISLSSFAQKGPGRAERMRIDRNDPVYLEQSSIRLAKAGKTLTTIGGSTLAAGIVLKLIGNSKANAPNREAWDGFGEQLVGLAGIAGGSIALGVGLGLLNHSKMNKKRLMNMQPSVSFHSLKYTPNTVVYPAAGVKINF